MKKKMELIIDEQLVHIADSIVKDDILSVIGSYVQLLSRICERNNIDLQIDLYGSNSNNTTINYDYSYENAD